jgi:CRISPR system Cascade subunit CasD
MSTLLMRLAGPLQSWGVDSKFERRGTENIPTKSGLIGLVAAAMGRKRNESIVDLQKLHFGVRVDHQGELLRDYHTAMNQKSAYVTQRYYLADALFLAGLEGDIELLKSIEIALQSPAYPLFLGRRSCPPEGKVSLGMREGKALLESLQDEPWLLSKWRQGGEASPVNLRITVETGTEGSRGKSVFRRDLPLTFDQSHRKYGFCCIREANPLTVSNPDSRRGFAPKPTKHDPMPELRMEE